MKMRQFMPVCAALALVACNNSPEEELSDEALSMEDVADAAADMDISVKPGEYRSTSELIELDLPGAPAQVQQMMQQAFAQGGSVGHTYCVTEEMTPEQWLSNMNESDCTVARFDGSGNKMDAVLECTDEQGLNGRIEMTGTASGDSSEMEMRFKQKIPEMGEANIHMRVKSERVGDCS